MRYFGLVLAAALAAAPARAQAPADTLRLTLDAAVQRALAQGEEMRLARAQVSATNGQVRQAFSEALPQITGTVTYTRQFASIYQNLGGGNAGGGDSSFTKLFKNTPFGAPNSWAFQVTGSQLLFSGGKVGAGLSAAKLARQAARYSRDQSAQDIASFARGAQAAKQVRNDDSDHSLPLLTPRPEYKKPPKFALGGQSYSLPFGSPAIVAFRP